MCTPTIEANPCLALSSLSDLGYKLMLGLLPSLTIPHMLCCVPLIGSHNPSTYILSPSPAPLLSIVCIAPLFLVPPSPTWWPPISRPFPLPTEIQHLIWVQKQSPLIQTTLQPKPANNFGPANINPNQKLIRLEFFPHATEFLIVF